MLKSNKEWVSEIVDGEADKHTVEHLVSDSEAHQEWQRYHMIGDAIRGELPEKIDLDLTANIFAAIEDEPTVMAPKAQQATQDTVVEPSSSKVVPLFKQFGQYAIAATVAMFAIVGVQNYQQPGADVESPLPVLNTRPLVGSVSPVSLQTGPVQQTAQEQTNEQMVEQRRRVNAYVQDHMLQQRLNPIVVNQANDQQ
ncbi:sigma-E factor negative regulatory protein [Shewanella maritima]|uniref:sigma-E factor negative regulatory protein n=1 Tax=Shewanella maritima TaxID=2520507 RepID=UPI0037362DEF